MGTTVVPPRSAAAGTADPAAAPPSAARLPSLTGLRWIAAFTIFCLHIRVESNYFRPDGDAQEFLDNALAAGRSGVSFFFILSGFVLAWSVRPQDSAGAFWWRRIAKIYPNHLVTLALAAGMMVYIGRDFDGEVFAYNVTMTQSWVPEREDVWYGFNGVSWSLGCELLFYLCFPFLHAGLRRLRPAAWWTIAALSVAAVVTIPLAAKPVARWTGWSERFLAFHLPPVRMVEFVLGIVLALLVRNGHWRGPGITVGFLVTGAGMWVAGLLSEEYALMRDSACTVVGFVIVVTAAARADVRGTRSVWRRPRLQRLGEVSFAFYLVHEMAIYTMRHTFGDDQPYRPWGSAVVLTAATFSLALVAAFLLHDHVEKPMMRLLTRRGKARRKV